MTRRFRARLLNSLFALVASALVAVPCLGAQGLMQLIDRANAAESSGRWSEATRLWQQLHHVAGGDPAPLYLVASAATRAGDAKTAMHALHQAISEGFVPHRPLATDSALVGLHVQREWPELVRQAKSVEAGRDSTLRVELLELARRDQKGRAGIDSIFARYGMPSPQADSALARMAASDSPVQARLQEIIRTRGWPGRRLVGDDAAHAAWLIAQHMDAAEQRRLLPLMQAAAKRGDARGADVALLEDRVATEDGGLQRYGSQLKAPRPGEPPELYPIDRPECVPQRRAAVYLEPIESYLEHFGVKWEGAGSKRCEEKRET